MTNRKQALQELLAKVESGEWTGDYSDIRDAQLASGCYGLNRAGLVWDTYNGSLDAALALHSAVLPGWGWTFPHKNNALLYGNSADRWAKGYHADNPARAWLQAILQALIAGEDE